MKICRDVILSVFKRDFIVSRGRHTHSISVFDVLRSLYPNEDRNLIAEIAAELSSMGQWVPRSSGNVDDWQWNHSAC